MDACILQIMSLLLSWNSDSSIRCEVWNSNYVPPLFSHLLKDFEILKRKKNICTYIY